MLRLKIESSEGDTVLSSDENRIDVPLVSLFMFCKDRKNSIRRSIDSMLAQTYQNIEIVVQDGASTDGTREILEGYGDRIKLVSEPDSGHAEAFWKVFQRCKGELIGSCASDEELAPNAAEIAVQRFRKEPHMGAFCSDMYITDVDGEVVGEAIGQPFNIVDYLFGTYCPFWPATFFRRAALADIGLFGKPESWTLDSLEFEIWIRLALRHEINYYPGFLSKYAFHDGQLSNTPKAFYEHIDGRMRVIEKLFSDEGFFGNDDFKSLCLYNQLYMFHHHVKSIRLSEHERHLSQLLNELPGVAGAIGDFKYGGWAAMSQVSPSWFKKLFPESLKTIARDGIYPLLSNAMMQMRSLASFAKTDRSPCHLEPASRTPMAVKRLNEAVGDLYEARGQISQAVRHWMAVAEDDAFLQSKALQALLKAPTTSSQQLLDAHLKWASEFARPRKGYLPHEFRPWDGQRPINVAYCATFFDTPCGYSQILPFIQNHDRQRFHIFAYSHGPCAESVKRCFDVFCEIDNMSDEAFIDQCRADQIDILVEMTGFSPAHRFSAMASRCAPVQIATFNHTGTTGVPNIDWVLTDEVSVPKELEPFYSEQIYRVKGSFICTNYDSFNQPDSSPAPRLRNGYITFGCFSSGGKINEPLINIWAEVLHMVPDAKIMLRSPQLDNFDNRRLRVAQFTKAGISEDRIILCSGTDRDGIIRSYADIDISFDTWPYCGGNTLCESLWQGVPAVSLLGERFTSRYGGALLHASGCGELVAKTKKEYVQIAVDLAADPKRLNHYRKNLRQMMFDFGFSDTQAYAKKLEAAYVDMLQMASGNGEFEG